VLKPVALLGQASAYAAFALFIGYFSVAPNYQHLEPGLALIKLSFSHAGAPRTPCRQRTAAELAALAPNMRRPTVCPRARVDLVVELAIDDKLTYRGDLPPAGLAHDGASTVYKRFPVPAGRHRVTVRLRDSVREEGFDHERSDAIELSPGQNFVIDFNPACGGFVFL